MPYIPPHYAPRDDWREKLINAPGYPVQSWQADIYIFWKNLDNSSMEDDLLVEKAWIKARMPKARAKGALSTLRPRLNNDVGLVPPKVAGRVFARSVGSSLDSGASLEVIPDPPIVASQDVEERSFKPARYRPRPNWRTRLQSMDPEEGSWQGDLVKYWHLRISGKTEEQAWGEVGMSQENARMALIKEPHASNEDSGLIPCIPEDPGRDTVARRVLARSVAKEIDADDIYEGLMLEPE